jgi:PAS domain S-box-containing protein
MFLPSLKKSKNIYFHKVVESYVNYCSINIEDSLVKESFSESSLTPTYTTEGYKLDAFNIEDLSKVFNTLFEKVNSKWGILNNKDYVENLALDLKNSLGVEKDFNESLVHFPDGLFDDKKVKFLTREQLEKKLLAYLQGNSNEENEQNNFEDEVNVLSEIVYHINEGVFVLDSQGNIAVFNKVMEEMTLYTSDEVIGQYADNFIRFFEKDYPLDVNTYSPQLQSGNYGELYSNSKLKLIDKNGSEKFVRVSSHTLTSENMNSVITVTDITKEIELENLKIDFVSMAAHELRTPLTAIRGYLSVLEDEILNSLDATYKQYLKNTVISANDLHTLIENLLNISRIEHGNLTIQKELGDWQKLIREVIELFKDSAEANNVSITFVEPKFEMPKNLKFDRIMMKEVLVNLLDNAISFNRPDGRVSIVLSLNDDSLVTNIKDTGVGIPSESNEHLFKKFYRVNTVLKSGKKGTGLGLFIAKELVTLHNGRIWFTSEEDKGSTFSFSLPLEN